MDAATLDAITRELFKEHGAAVSDDDELWRALRLLPDIAEWAIAESVPAVFALSPEGTLFIVRTSEGGTVSVQSRPLDEKKLVVGMLSRKVRATDTEIVREASWTFRYVTEVEGALRDEWQDIAGTVYLGQDGDERRRDQRETFARAIASRAGWPAIR
jgi:hypothetical protein